MVIDEHMKSLFARDGFFSDGIAEELKYRVYISEHEQGDKLPLVLFLHGAGERGGDNEKQINIGFPAFYTSGTYIQKYPAVVIAPQCPDDKQWVDTPWSDGDYSLDRVGETDYIKLAAALVQSFASKDYVDEKRLYVTGISMGGFGTWNIIMNHPTMFAAALPICGGADRTKAGLIKNIPIKTFHGADDDIVPPEGTRVMVDALRNVGGNISFTEYPGCGHGSWDLAYAEPETFEWLFSQSK